MRLAGGDAVTYMYDNAGASVSQEVIDQVLCTGGNEFNSAERIAVFYMRERSEQDNAAFLRREFGTENGRGIEYEAANMPCGSWKMASILLKVIVSAPGTAKLWSHGSRFQLVFWNCWR